MSPERLPVGPLAAARVFVADVGAARAFYGGLLGLNERFGDEAMAVYDAGVDLVVERQDPADPEEGDVVGRFLGLSLRVEDAAAAHAALAAAGADLLGPPEAQPWGGVLLHLRDPSGNVVTLLQPPGDG